MQIQAVWAHTEGVFRFYLRYLWRINSNISLRLPYIARLLHFNDAWM